MKPIALCLVMLLAGPSVAFAQGYVGQPPTYPPPLPKIDLGGDYPTRVTRHHVRHVHHIAYHPGLGTELGNVPMED